MGVHPLTGRPLPLHTQDNEFFWTSGADGKLRFQECVDCRALIDPPAPVCRYCRSHNLGVRAVSGRASLARHVLCFRTLWEATYNELMKQGKIAPPGGRTTSWLIPFGATSAAHTLAQNAQRHMHRYGTTKETLGWIALNQRANAESTRRRSIASR